MPPGPPFSLAATPFRFRALAVLAGRSPLGGARETGLACYVAARLASAILPPVSLGPDERDARATAARQWLASLALPAPLRAPLTRLFETTRTGLDDDVSAALVTVADAAASYLDGPALAELRALAVQLS